MTRFEHLLDRLGALLRWLRQAGTPLYRIYKQGRKKC